jgi:hypothetical protein
MFNNIMRILFDIPVKNIMSFSKFNFGKNELFFVSSKSMVYSKLKNSIQNLELNKLDESNIDVFILGNINNKIYYENHINKYNDNKYYVFSLYPLFILNPNCECHRTIKHHKICDVIPNLFIQDINENTKLINEPKDKPDIKIVEKEVKKKQVRDNKKEVFRKLCLSYLEKMRSIDIRNNIKLNSNKEAVLIEYRILPHVEVLLRNMILQLGNEWSYTIICGTDNYTFMKEIANTVDTNIKVIKSIHNVSSQNDYNNLLTSREFWDLLNGEKLLIYQEDSLIFNSNIDDFLAWDYIGAPFRFLCIQPNNVGNGGFSLRSKSKMLEVIYKYPIKKIEDKFFSSSVIQYKNKHKLDVVPEDVYFSQLMQLHDIGKVSDFITANKFSSETVYNENSLGMHCMWFSCKKWTVILNQYFKKLKI